MTINKNSILQRTPFRLLQNTWKLIALVFVLTFLNFPAYAGTLTTSLAATPPSNASRSRPNFIFIFTDNQGYQDLGVYGSPNIKTPNIDRLANEGIRFTDFYSQPFCGPSRATLMTGSYPPRISMSFNHLPKAKTGIHHNEITIAELLQEQGYATALIGKWHLGDHPQFLPLRHGFDEYYGIPYSNDMWPFHPNTSLTYPLEDEHSRLQIARQRADLTGFDGQPNGSYFQKNKNFPDLPFYLNDEVIELNPDTNTLTARFTNKTLAFIETNQSQPFFLYLAHAMPHTPLGVSEEFRGISERGLYGDVVAEIDWGVGQIIYKLKELGLHENTLVAYVSDNGPWMQYGIDSGSAWPFRGGCCNELEGASRVPAIMYWPNHIPPGLISSEIVGLIDIYPTFANLAGASIPNRQIIDGKDISSILLGNPDAKSPHEAFYYYLQSDPGNANLRAVRSGKWKLHVSNQNSRFIRLMKKFGLMKNLNVKGDRLYNLESDTMEVNNLIKDHPEIVKKLELLANKHNMELLSHIRPIGKIN